MGRKHGEKSMPDEDDDESDEDDEEDIFDCNSTRPSKA
jgi:hypothetical protein